MHQGQVRFLAAVLATCLLSVPALAQPRPDSGSPAGLDPHATLPGRHTTPSLIVLSPGELRLRGNIARGHLLESISEYGAQTRQAASVLRHMTGEQPRPLILVNGHRWLADSGTPVGSSLLIPASTISKVEILPPAADPPGAPGDSSGGGVINVITRQTWSTATASAFLGVYETPGHWGGVTQGYNVGFAVGNDRGSVIVSAGYLNGQSYNTPGFGYPGMNQWYFYTQGNYWINRHIELSASVFYSRTSGYGPFGYPYGYGGYGYGYGFGGYGYGAFAPCMMSSACPESVETAPAPAPEKPVDWNPGLIRGRPPINIRH